MQNAPESLPVGVVDGVYLASLTKACSKCGEVKPTSMFNANRSRPDGLKVWCKACSRESTRKWKEENGDRVRKTTREWAARQDPGRAKANYRAWAEKNPEKAKAAADAWRKKNPEKARAAHREWERANHETQAAKRREWQELNEEKYKAYQRAWREANVGRLRSAGAKRRARAAAAPWASPPAIRDVYEEARNLSSRSGTGYAVDHIYPLLGATVSGLHVESNLRVIPARVNSRKRHSLPGFLAHELWDPTGLDVFHE